jgi:hypothetical protein
MAGIGSAAADAMKKALFSLIRASQPTIAYHGFYSAKVVVQSGDRKTVDLQPDDTRLPPMAQVPIKLGIPGSTVVVPAGDTMLIGWENGDPQRAYACLFPTGDTLKVLSITAEKIELGGQDLIALLEQVVIGKTPCQFTGAPHAVGGSLSSRVFAKE